MTRRSVALAAAALFLCAGSMPLVAQKAPAPAAPAVRTEPVNLNAATAAQLAALPGIGPKTAQLIIDYRQKNGGFKKIEEIMNVRGIGEKSFLKLKGLITVTPVRSDRVAGGAIR